MAIGNPEEMIPLLRNSPIREDSIRFRNNIAPEIK
jgi:hypothetical protein